ncbi:prepilin-type N-terminal cleavage/methylation domain-containing protein (plasmid) [Parasedimentitalea marina]|uniref:Prepilin-type N-terminal cleavage/methylation domain-containing protein n=1 Tax=Parasedimentitalea marina TaxID=2483033 RepID=A0A3T0N973_9RHOB|nr:prepilin-type N-terminal cleavage/methylation domain-containing protein [Parasedimentitalea marina]
MGLKLETQPIHSDAGFTLIELLVSLAILAVLAIAAVLSLPRGLPRRTAIWPCFRSSFRQPASGQSRGTKVWGSRCPYRDCAGLKTQRRLAILYPTATLARPRASGTLGPRSRV